MTVKEPELPQVGGRDPGAGAPVPEPAHGGEALALSVGTIETVIDASRGDALDLGAGLAGPAARLTARALEVEA